MSQRTNPTVQVLSRRLRMFADQGPAKFQWFLASDEFRDRFNRIPPACRRRAIQAIAEAEARVNDGLPPPVKAQRMGDGKKCHWKHDPAQRSKLARAYAIAGDDHEKAGRILRCTADAARLARKRYLNAPAAEQARAAA